MIRRINFTARKRIVREHVRILLREIGGKVSFSVEVDLRSYSLPPGALVFVEAYRETVWMRFSLGTVGDLRVLSPEDSYLSEFDSPEGLLFRVRVTATGQNSEAHGLLLAEADQIPFKKPDEVDENKIPLLPVVPTDLGDELWQVRIDDRARLYINRSAGDHQQIAWSPTFFSLVFPAIVRHILTRILVVDRDAIDLEDSADWRTHWLWFGMAQYGVGEPPVEGDVEVRIQWIEDVVASFSRRQGVLSKFCKSLELEGVL